MHILRLNILPIDHGETSHRVLETIVNQMRDQIKFNMENRVCTDVKCTQTKPQAQAQIAIIATKVN